MNFASLFWIILAAFRLKKRGEYRQKYIAPAFLAEKRLKRTRKAMQNPLPNSLLAALFAVGLCAEEMQSLPLPEIESPSTPLVAEEMQSLPLSEIESPSTPLVALGSQVNAAPAITPEGYTINYNTVPILEYVRFASKICNANFIFNDADLNFTVTVVSDAPITPENVMSTLIQVLRMHGLELLEQENNLVIHKASDVRQIATLVTESGQGNKAAIVTRIFRIKNAKVDSLAAIIRPMISSSSLLETSLETRQLILTDVRTNVDKVAALIEVLDAPSMPLEIKTYAVIHGNPEMLIDLASKILTPIAQGNPFVLVPHTAANSIYVVSTPELAERALSIFQIIDTPFKPGLTERKLKSENIFIYKPLHRGGKELLKSLTDLADNLQSSGLTQGDLITTIESGRWIGESNSLLFVGSKESLDKIKELLENLDLSTTPAGEETSFFIYRPQNRSAKEIQNALDEMVQNLKSSKITDKDLLATLTSAKLNESANSLTFSGEERTFAGVKEILTHLDVKGPSRPSSQKQVFFLYKPQAVPPEQIEKSLKDFAHTLDKSKAPDENLITTIRDMQVVEATGSILFTGSDATLKRLQELLPSFDTAQEGALAGGSSQFFIYKPRSVKADQLAASLKEMTENLQSSQFSDPALLRTLQSVRYVKSTNSFLFTGDSASIKKVEDLIATIDKPGALKAERNFILYEPKYASKEKTETYLKQLADNLAKKGGSEELLSAIRSMKWVEVSHSFMFYGNDAALNQLTTLLQNFDTPAQGTNAPSKPGYYIYKVQHTTGDVIEEDLDQLAKNFDSSGLKDAKIVEVIRNIRYVKETNSLLLTGDPKAIEETRQIIEQYDYPRAASAKGSSNFFMYKPQHLSASQLQKSLRDVAESLKAANLADPGLLSAIATAKYVETTNSIIFTGTPDTIQKIQGILKDIDVAAQTHAPIQKVGKTTFLLYKLKNASGPQITTSLQNMLGNLKNSNATDPDFLAALHSMKYIKETNSLLFTGNEEALKRIETLVEQFDVTSLGAPAPVKVASSGPTDYFLYRPQATTGPELEQNLKDFAENLQASGHSDPDLYNAIDSGRWIEKTQNLVFTGTPKALDRVKDLLKTFDVPSALPASTAPIAPEFATEPTIQAIDNTSFLVYKLQFHKGDEIQGALRQIAKDLINANAPINQTLLNSINSIQWLQVTNSLLCSGDQETLTRLRELIKNLDIPLKQVFIEILVIETTLTNALSFGLEWGSNFQFRNQYAGSTFNTIPSSSAPSAFDTALGALAPPNTPTPQLIAPPAGGFDLGVIGEVIKHNGQTFLTLGSLLTALQSDGETSIVMTPKIIAQDGRTSTLFQGTNTPFTGSFVANTQQGGTVQTTNIEYRDIGMNLTVTPVLGNSDIVTLDISFDQSQITGSSGGTVVVGGSSVSSGLITSKTTMQTTVHVPDQHFLILTGNVNNSNVKTKSGIPCLGGLPLIGAAFSSTSDTLNSTNIVVFLRPHILNSIDDMKQVSSQQEEFFRDQSGTPFLQHNFDEAMDYVKSIDDD